MEHASGHHRIHPAVKRSSSSLGTKGNSSFSAREDGTKERRKSMKPYLEHRPSSMSGLSMPPSPKHAYEIEPSPSHPTIEEFGEDTAHLHLRDNGGGTLMSETEAKNKAMYRHMKGDSNSGNRFEPSVVPGHTLEEPIEEYVSTPKTKRPEVYTEITAKSPSSSTSAKPPRAPSPESDREDHVRLVRQESVIVPDSEWQPLAAIAGRGLEPGGLEYTARVVASYWCQIGKDGESSMHKNQPTRHQIKELVERILMDTEVESKEKLYQEVKYIVTHFKQRRCVNFCKEEKKLGKAIKKLGIKLNKSRQFCVCGLPKEYHSDQAISKSVSKWHPLDNTELVHPWTFGNLDIPGHYNYLETPEGTRKYIRFDDLKTNPAHLWGLLRKHWNLKSPNLVISLTGGDIKSLHENVALQQSFTNGILKSAVTTKAWIFTDGFHLGASREISGIFQENLQRSEWAENDDHASIPLIGITPWGVVADRKNLIGINVGVDEAIYLYTSIEKHSQTSIVPNALDPNHVVYLLPDDGTTGRYLHEPLTRLALEKYIRKHTSLELIGAKDVKTPVVILVLGGDQFTMEKLAECTREENQISVVIVNNSGPLASMLAEAYQKLEKERPRSKEGRYGWSQEEEEILNNMIPKFESDGLLPHNKDKERLKTIMQARHLIEVFGVTERDTKDLDKAILEATFGGTRDIAVQLNLTLAMDRCDIASSCIFVESRKKELQDVSETLQEVLLVAMETGRTKFVELLLDQDYGGQLDFKKLLTVDRLYRLHSANLNPSAIMGKVLRSMCKKEKSTDCLLERHQLLPQVGRIIYQLMGDNYRLLYQEEEYRRVSNKVMPLRLTVHPKEEPAWHLLLWACLANQKEMAEFFLFETSCKIGAALIAFEMFSEMSKRASILSETELTESLLEKSQYFQTLAMEILDNLYAFDRDEAYAALTALIPFHWSSYATPLHIADDTEAMRFIGHSCCQTLLQRIWYKYMDLDTRSWRLFPLFLFFPINLTGIVFDKENLNYGTYKIGYAEKIREHKSTVPYSSNRIHTNSESTYGYENKAFGSLPKLEAQDSMADNIKIVEREDSYNSREESCGRKAWFRIKNYYTSPVNKFFLYFMTWLVFIGIFTHLLLHELKPVSSISEVGVFEWLTIIWVICLTLDEIKQFAFTKCSGPLYNLKWNDIPQSWSETWYLHERVFFVLRLHKVTNWVEDNWNKVDLLMILCFWASVICRHTVVAAHFTVVRIIFSITIIIFYYRILRISYIMKNIGPRVITIHAMMKDLLNFMLVLAIFVLSFGVAFQAILSPNRPLSIEVVVDVLWRPYWQMFGELFIDDATTGMGRANDDTIQCTLNESLAHEQPELHPFCYHWMAPVLLGVFMLFTNILLLNLLIAIFSHSFEKIESEAQTIWRYHMYDLVHEYYHQVWLPPPVNILCHLTNITVWLSKWPRKWAYKAAKRRHLQALENKRHDNSLIALGPEAHFFKNFLEKQVQEELKNDCCYRFYYTEDDKFYYDERQKLEVTHFCQPEIMRDDDLEEKAYKRHLRSAAKHKERNVHKILKLQNEKLWEIAADIQDFRGNAKELNMAGNTSNDQVRDYFPIQRPNVHPNVMKKMERMDERLDSLDHKLDLLLRSMEYHNGDHKIQKRISNHAV